MDSSQRHGHVRMPMACSSHSPISSGAVICWMGWPKCRNLSSVPDLSPARSGFDNRRSSCSPSSPGTSSSGILFGNHHPGPPTCLPIVVVVRLFVIIVIPCLTSSPVIAHRHRLSPDHRIACRRHRRLSSSSPVVARRLPGRGLSGLGPRKHREPHPLPLTGPFHNGYIEPRTNTMAVKSSIGIVWNVAHHTSTSLITLGNLET